MNQRMHSSLKLEIKKDPIACQIRRQGEKEEEEEEEGRWAAFTAGQQQQALFNMK